MSSIGELWVSLGIDTSATRQGVQQFQNEIGKASTGLSQMEVVGRRAFGAISAALGAISLGKLVSDIIKTRSEYEATFASFKVMLQSKREADSLMQRAVEFAKTTPFELSDVTTAIKQLLAYGSSVEEVMTEMQHLGDVASALNVGFSDMAYLYGTLRTQGRAYTQDIRQFTTRGIPILEELAKVMGVNRSEVMKLVEEGKVGFPEVQKAIYNMSSEGGKFFGMMREQMETLRGKTSNFSDAWHRLLTTLGESKAWKSVIGFATDLVSKLDDLLKGTDPSKKYGWLTTSSVSPALEKFWEEIRKSGKSSVGDIQTYIQNYVNNLQVLAKVAESEYLRLSELDKKAKSNVYKIPLERSRQEVEYYNTLIAELLKKMEDKGWIENTFLPGLVAQRQTAEEARKELEELLKQTSESENQINQMGMVFGESYDVAKEKAELYKKTVEELIKLGYGANSEVVQKYRDLWHQMNSQVEMQKQIEENEKKAQEAYESTIKIFQEYEQGQKKIHSMSVLMGKDYEALSEEADLLKSTMEKLLEAGYGMDSEEIIKMADRLSEVNKQLKEQEKLQEALQEKEEERRRVLDVTSDVIADMSSVMGEMFIDARKGAVDFIETLLRGVQELIIYFLKLAIIKALSGEAQKGLPGLITGAVAVGGLLALWEKYRSQVERRELGGIIGGHSYGGDQIPVFANAGEMILNHSQQANLFRMLNNPFSLQGSEIKLRVEGEDLVAVLNYNRMKRMRYGVE